MYMYKEEFQKTESLYVGYFPCTASCIAHTNKKKSMGAKQISKRVQKQEKVWRKAFIRLVNAK